MGWEKNLEVLLDYVSNEKHGLARYSCRLSKTRPVISHGTYSFRIDRIREDAAHTTNRKCSRATFAANTCSFRLTPEFCLKNSTIKLETELIKTYENGWKWYKMINIHFCQLLLGFVALFGVIVCATIALFALVGGVPLYADKAFLTPPPVQQ